MRLFISIELADGKYQPMRADHSAEYAGPLATFIAQLAAGYLRTADSAPERRAHDKAIVSYQTSLRQDGAKLDRSA